MRDSGDASENAASRTAKSPRGRRRKTDLIAATRRAILKHGMNVQLVQIAAEAQVTSGAILYHYPNVSDLIGTAYVNVLERFTRTRSEQIRNLPSPVCQLHTALAGGVPSNANDTDVALLAQLSAAATFKPEYSELVNDFFDRQVDMYRGIVEALKVTGNPIDIARSLVSLEDGIGYRVLADHPALNAECAYELLLSAAAAFCGPLHCEHIDAAAPSRR